ncbi:MAG: carboxypeptidase regulatory-like domain-containing protein, partial [Terracidiphilus sp.]
MKSIFRRQFLHLAGFALLLVLALLPASAQQTTGSIAGTVKDQRDAVVNTATIKATNVDTGLSRSAKVNGIGEFRIDNLPVGKYTVQADAATFERFLQENLALDVNQTLTLDIKLVVGAPDITITVSEAPPQVNTSDAVLGRTIEQAEIIGLPLVNRNAYAELSLTPGIMANSAGPTSSTAATPDFTVGLPSTQVQVNGGLDSGNGTVGFYLDGGNNITGMRNYGNPAPNPDAIEEFRVDTNAFQAQYGQFSGAVVSVITKSGTNKYHGSLFEFNRNTDFNAYQWSIPAPTAKAPFHRNNFGGTFGGPIKHDKAFYFFSYAGLRQIQGTTVTGATVPTAAERLGDFSADKAAGLTPIWMPGTYNSTTKTGTPVSGTNAGPGCGPGNTNTGYCIPQASLDTTALNLTNVTNGLVNIPLAAPSAAITKTGGQSYGTIYNTPTDSNEYLGKFDDSYGNDHLGVTYFYINTKSTPSGGGNVNWTGVQSAATQMNINLSDVHTFTANVANQAWLTLTRAMGGRVMIPVAGPANQTLASFGS